MENHRQNQLQTNDKIIHSSLPLFIDKVKSSVDSDKLTVLKGERRTPNREGIMDKLLKDPLSARLHLKRINHRDAYHIPNPIFCA